MGGRGGSSGISGKDTKVSPMVARVYYNSAKKEANSSGAGARDNGIERAIRSGNTSFIDNISTEKEARRVSEYLSGRITENSHKIVKLGSPEKLQKTPKLAAERKNILALRNAIGNKMHEFSKKPEAGNTNIHDLSRTTTTYDRARKRRMSNFDDWFFGSKK